MRIARAQDDGEMPINTSSLVDIMFILIIFFLVTTSFAKEERDISVNLPETDTSLSSAVRVIVVNVQQDGSVFVGEERVSVQGLQARIHEALKGNPEQKVLIRGDQAALHGDVAGVLAACRSIGVREANIGFMVTGR